MAIQWTPPQSRNPNRSRLGFFSSDQAGSPRAFGVKALSIALGRICMNKDPFNSVAGRQNILRNSNRSIELNVSVSLLQPCRVKNEDSI
jgi:hypothetical protein